MAAWPGCEVVAAIASPTAPLGAGKTPAVCRQGAGRAAFRSSSRSTKDEADRAASPGSPRRAGRRRLRPHSAPIRADIPTIGPFTPRPFSPCTGARPPSSGDHDGNHLTGITIMRMERGLIPPMLLQRALGIGIDDTAATMHDELADLGGRLMVEVFGQYADGDPSTPIPQEEALATYAAKLTKADGHIDWDEDAAVIHARIRA
ncbi:MAG: hypothetical protein ACLR7Z_09635 [Bilophila wadsworthia]